MDTLDQIKKQQQAIARDEQSLALTKLKKRRADTRRKIELGGLVIKSGIGSYNKAIILGILSHAKLLIEKEASYKELFEFQGKNEFLSCKK